jgi:UDP-hydrolysing UDP-N-acetyl-D-glucosamine 2-epimerase
MTRRICVFTGSRADYGVLYWLLKEIVADPRLELQLLVSGSHLTREFGETWRQIETDGFSIDARVDMLLASDEPVAVAKSMALGLMGCAEALERLKPDVLVVLGDRYEALAAAEAAMLLRVPIAHIHGGEATEGAIDDAIRHAITKMAHLHFAAAEPYRERIIQLGEHPDRVFTVGAPGLDHVTRTTLLDRGALERVLRFRFAERNLLVTCHPATLATEPASASLRRLFEALDRFPALGIVITKSNADVAGREINASIDAYATGRPGRVFAASSLGQQRYLSVMTQVDAVVGNSSSGIIEAPALGKPTVNIGPRQQGRVRAPSVIDCADDTQSIVEAIERALSPDMQALAARRVSPYGTGGASTRIKDILASVDLAGLLMKSFHTMKSPEAVRTAPAALAQSPR